MFLSLWLLQHAVHRTVVLPTGGLFHVGADLRAALAVTHGLHRHAAEAVPLKRKQREKNEI